MYDLLIGPMLGISLLVFIVGLAYRWRQYSALTREMRINTEALPKDMIRAVENRERDEYLRIDSANDVVLKYQLKLKRTILGKAPVFMAITVVFHVLLLLLPVFVVGHSILLDDYFGFGLPAFSETTTDNLTVLFLMLAGFFFFRRIFVAKVRSVTTYRDWIAWLAPTAPFLTGFLAYHQYFDYETVLYLHIICGELMLVAIPFTKLAHMPFFFFSRFLIRNELTIGSGSRKWAENN